MPIIIIALLVARIVVSNALASFGEKVRQIDTRIADFTEENELLTQQVASASSLITITARANELGFVEPAKNQIMTMVEDQFPVALK